AHKEPLELIRQLDAYLATDGMVGQVDAAIFLAAILNGIVTGYFVVMDEFENEVDSLDDDLLADSGAGDVLDHLVSLRHVATELRRAITAHRDVFGSLAWTDFEAIAETHATGRFQLVSERFDRAVDAVEN